MKFKSDIEVQAGLRDSSGSLGSSGQILSTTSGNVSWVTPTVNTVATDVQNQVKAGVAINKGQAVYVTGADGTNIIVGLASNTSEATSSKTLGLLNATVATNGFADVVQIGRLAGLNTIGATAGDPVWLGTNGNLIYGLINKPYAPAHLVFLGVVTRVNANNGEIFVNVQNGFELKEIHDVDIVTNVPINGDVLGYDGTLWVNKTIAEWLGYTPANANGTTNYVSKFTGTTTLGNSQIFDNGTNVGIGTSSPTVRLDVSGAVNVRSAAPTITFDRNSSYTWRLVNGDGVTYPTSTFNIANNAGTSVATFLDSGNVGIGTTSPSIKLQVETSVNGSGGIWARNTNTGTSAFGSINCVSGVGAINLRAHSAAHSIWANTSMINSASAFTGGMALFQDGANPISLWTNGSERMRITSAGNIGIGTTVPNAKLEVSAGQSFINQDYLLGWNVAGSATLRAYIIGTSGNELQFWNRQGGTNTQAITLNASGNVGIGATSPVSIGTGITTLDIQGSAAGGIAFGLSGTKNYIYGASTMYVEANTTAVFVTNSVEKMRITAGGYVGIGTSAPGSKLTVDSGDVTLTNGNLYVAVGSGNAYSSKLSTALNYPQVDTYLDSIGGSSWEGRLNFRTSSNGGSLTTKMTIIDSGNVGVGTTSPGAKLDVFGTSRISATTPTQEFFSTANGDVWVSIQGVSGTGTGGSLSISTKRNGDSLTEKVRILDNGNVGIGTSNPQGKLTIKGGAQYFEVDTDNSGTSLLSYDRDLGLYGNVNFRGNNFIFSPSDVEKVRITNAGNVGIGTSNPLAKLHVAGSLRNSFASGSGGDVYMNIIDGVSNGFRTVATTSNQIDYTFHNGSNQEVLSILNSGNVGIGTSSPGAKLDVSGSTRSTEFVFPQTDFNPSAAARTTTSPMSIKMWNNYFSGIGLGSDYGTVLEYYSLVSHVDSQVYFDAGGGSWYRTASYSSNFGSWQKYLTSSEISGTTNYVSKFTGANSLGNSLIYDNGTNVGIGTTSPAQKLDVAGQIQMSGTTAANAILGGIAASWAGNAQYPTLYGTDVTRWVMHINPHISYTQNGVNGYTGVMNGSTVRFASDTAANTYWDLGVGVNGVGTDKFALGRSSNSFLTVTNSGNVGIGTTNPSTLLHLYKTSYPVLTIDSGTIAGNVGIDTGNSFLNVGTTSNHPLVFGTNNSEKVRITSAGNVGIGTSSPLDKLDVFGNQFLGDGTNTSQLYLRGVTGVSYAWTVKNLATGYQVKSTSPGAGDGFNIDFNNNVGIGTTTPGAKLDVNGDALINNITIGRGPGNISTNTALGTGALDSTTTANYNIAVGWGANTNNNANGLTAIGVDLNVGPDTGNLGQDCLAIAQFNSNADTAQVPHIYAPKPISIGGGATNIITFDLLHYAGAIVEYLIRYDDGGDYAVGTVYMGWKTSGSGNMIDKRQIEWNNMSGFVFSLGGSGQTLVLTNTSGNNAWIRITVRGMMTN